MTDTYMLVQNIEDAIRAVGRACDTVNDTSFADHALTQTMVMLLTIASQIRAEVEGRNAVNVFVSYCGGTALLVYEGENGERDEASGPSFKDWELVRRTLGGTENYLHLARQFADKLGVELREI